MEKEKTENIKKEKNEPIKVELESEIVEPPKKEKIKTQTTKVNTVASIGSPFKMAFNMLKNNSSGLLISILSIILSIFVFTFSFSIKAQTGVTLVATIILAIYVIMVGICSLLFGILGIFITKDRLNKTNSLFAFIISIISLLLLIGSILVIYLT